MPVRIKYLKKENGMQRGSLSIRSWRTQCGWGYSFVVMTQTAKEYLACSWQLTADGFYPHTGFPHHVYSSFVRFRMTPYRLMQESWNRPSEGARWRTQCGWGYSLAVMTQIVKEYLACSWQLTADGFYLHTVFSITAADPSRSFRMTFNVSLIMTLFHPIVILNGVRMPCEKDEKTE